MPGRQLMLPYHKVPTPRERMLDIIERSTHSMQAYDPSTRSLKLFQW